MFFESMFPMVEFVAGPRPVILGLDGNETALEVTRTAQAQEAPFVPRIHLNSHRPLWCLGMMRTILEKDYDLPVNSTEANEKIVFFSASVRDENQNGGVLHVLLRTTLGAAMTEGVGGMTQLECFVRTLATPVGARREKKKRTRYEGPKLDFYQSGLQRLAERCAIEMCTQDTPGAPTVRDAIVALGEASTVLAGLKVRGEETVE